MRKLITVFCLLPLISFASSVHTIHDINVLTGDWHGRLSIISAMQPAYFLTAEGKNLGQIYDFELSGGHRLTYGLGFDAEKTDFNVSYSLTVYENGFTEKACVFVVTAKGPGVPDVRIESYNQASCEVKKGRQRGRDFFIA